MAFKKQLLSSLVFILLFHLAHSQGGDTTTSHNAQARGCPHSKPVPCLPETFCCSYAEYCSNKSHSCEPCFGGLTDQDALRQCLKNPYFKEDGPCKYACYEKFIKEMGNRTIKGEEPSKQPSKEPSVEDGKTPPYVYVLAAIITVLTIVIILQCVYYNRNCLKDNPAIKDDLTCVKTDNSCNGTEHTLAHSNESIGINRRPTALRQESTPTDTDLDVNRHPMEGATEIVPLLNRNVDTQHREDDNAAPASGELRPWHKGMNPTSSSEAAKSAVVTSACRGVNSV